VLLYKEYHQWYELQGVVVEREHRRRGLGNALLHAVCTWADMNYHNLALYVQPLGPGGMSRRALFRWYDGFGFKRGKFSLMRRAPASLPNMYAAHSDGMIGGCNGTA